jgi:hypothetical protein
MAIPIHIRDYNTVMQHYFDKQKESGLAQCPALLHFLSFLDPRDHFGFLVMCQALPNAEVICIPRAVMRHNVVSRGLLKQFPHGSLRNAASWEACTFSGLQIGLIAFKLSSNSGKKNHGRESK